MGSTESVTLQARHPFSVVANACSRAGKAILKCTILETSGKEGAIETIARLVGQSRIDLFLAVGVNKDDLLSMVGDMHFRLPLPIKGDNCFCHWIAFFTDSTTFDLYV